MLTGGIGSGKSRVADIFASLGVPVVDADVISHQLTGPNGAAIEPIRQAFGSEAIGADGGLDRDYMRTLVFQNPDQRRRLEDILHPLIRLAAEAALRATRGRYAIYAVPLWVESQKRAREAGQDEPPLVNGVIVVDCPEEAQLERVMARSKLTRDQVARILSAQATRDERLAIATHVIKNNSSLEALKSAVTRLHQELNQP